MILPEVAAAGIYNSQIAMKNTIVSKNRKTSMFEIELPMDYGGISYINDLSMQIIPNMLICAKPGQIRHTKFPFRCYYIHMILNAGKLYDNLLNTPDFLLTEKTEIYKTLFEKIIKHYNTFRNEDEIMMQSLILELIYTLRQDAVNYTKYGNERKNNSFQIEKILTYIKQNLTEDLSLETVAKKVSMSPIHFHNCFKSAVGKTLRDYVEEQRIKKAINLLFSTDLSLTEIAFECGFSSQSYFSFVFHRRMQKSPRAYVQDIYKKYEL